jgi:hypothetical protein
METKFNKFSFIYDRPEDGTNELFSANIVQPH